MPGVGEDVFSLCQSAPVPAFSCLCREGDAGAALVAAGNSFMAAGRVERSALPACGGLTAHLWALTRNSCAETVCHPHALTR